jgi:hypothetical protein
MRSKKTALMHPVNPNAIGNQMPILLAEVGGRQMKPDAPLNQNKTSSTPSVCRSLYTHQRRTYSCGVSFLTF